MKIVLDTNILVSALLRADGKPADIVNLVAQNKLSVVYDSRILLEYEDVLFRSKFGFDHDDVLDLLKMLKCSGISVTPTPVFSAFVEESDRKFYEVAKSVDAFLLTGNKRHYPNDDFVLNATEFLILFKESTGLFR